MDDNALIFDLEKKKNKRLQEMEKAKKDVEAYERVLADLKKTTTVNEKPKQESIFNKISISKKSLPFTDVVFILIRDQGRFIHPKEITDLLKNQYSEFRAKEKLKHRVSTTLQALKRQKKIIGHVMGSGLNTTYWGLEGYNKTIFNKDYFYG